MGAEYEPDLAWLRGKPGTKWAAVADGVLPAWIADMDFATPGPVREALSGLVAGDDLGYPVWLHRGTPLRAEFAARMRTRYGWDADPAHVREFCDIIQALQATLYVTTRPGDAIAMHVPMYPPFLNTPAQMGRTLVPVPLTRGGDGSWTFDAEAFARDVAERNVRVLVLVNPHNPTGRVLDRTELTALAAVARDHDLLVISDEIHADLTYAPHEHIPFASLSADAAGRTVTLTSATKAFNIAGVRCAVAHVGAAWVRDGFDRLPPMLLGDVGQPGVVATLAAWREGDAWLAGVRERLDANRALLTDALVPAGVRVDPPQATYLAWLDFRDTAIDGDPAAYVLDKAKVMLSPGPEFGPGGEGFARLNFATSAAVLTEICERITGALPRAR